MTSGPTINILESTTYMNYLVGYPIPLDLETGSMKQRVV